MDCAYTDPIDAMPATADIADAPAMLDGVAPDQIDAITAQPISPTLPTDNTIQTLSDSGGYPSTTPAPEVDSRPPHVQGGKKKKRVRGGKGQKQAKTDKPAEPYKLPDNPSLPHINIRQRRYLHALLDPTSPTYDNQTESYKLAYGTTNTGVAAAKGSALVRTGKIHTWIEEILKAHGVDTQARVCELALLAHSKSQPRVIHRVLTDHRGRRQTIDIEEAPTAGERLRAIDQLNKLSGDYAKAQTAGSLQAQSDYDSLLTRTFTQDKVRCRRADKYKDDDGSMDDDGGEGLTGGA